MIQPAFGVFISMVMLAGTAMSQQVQHNIPWVGTWRLDPAKSSAGAPRSGTVRIEEAADGIRVTSDAVNQAGATTHTEYSAKFDGVEVPIAGAPAGATVAATRTGPRGFEVVTRSQGATTYSRNEISADGLTRTVSQRLVIGDRETRMTLVYERDR